MARQSNHNPQTPFAIWFKDALERRNAKVAPLAAKLGIDYSHLYKIWKGEPDKYPSSRRPGYENTYAIGVELGDLEGALLAAEYVKKGETITLPEGGVMTSWEMVTPEGNVVTVKRRGERFVMLKPTALERLDVDIREAEEGQE